MNRRDYDNDIEYGHALHEENERSMNRLLWVLKYMAIPSALILLATGVYQIVALLIR